jgi:hypothetical protein
MIAEQQAPIVEPARTKVEHSIIDDRDRTDPTLAHRSVGDHPWLAICLALRDVVVCKLSLEQYHWHRALFDEQDGTSCAQGAAGQSVSQGTRGLDA